MTISRRGRRLLFAQGADAATFAAFMLLAGPSVHVERNPAVAGLMAAGGVWLVVAAKMADSLWIAWRFDRTGQSRFGLVRRANALLRTHIWWRPLGIFLISLAVACGVVGAGFNTASLIDTLVRR